MSNIKNKTRKGVISIYHECIYKDLATEVSEMFKNYMKNGYGRDGCTGTGINKDIKDTTDMNPHYDFPIDDPLRKLVQELENNVMDCVMDYYEDNRGMLYGYGNFSKGDYSKFPEPVKAFPHIFHLQHGQLQYYAENSNGYTANHCESFIVEGMQEDSDYRNLTWMLTLNDLPATKEQHGYTVFTNQNIAVRPKAGQLVLFSPWMDCEHRGNPTNGHEKVIITSWVSRKK